MSEPAPQIIIALQGFGIVLAVAIILTLTVQLAERFRYLWDPAFRRRNKPSAGVTAGEAVRTAKPAAVPSKNRLIPAPPPARVGPSQRSGEAGSAATAHAATSDAVPGFAPAAITSTPASSATVGKTAPETIDDEAGLEGKAQPAAVIAAITAALASYLDGTPGSFRIVSVARSGEQAGNRAWTQAGRQELMLGRGRPVR
ncbi:MAG: hypothetical protein HYY09_02010 [Firmicutes bacterium]|nr:hypothetical protein [Bacillota bacterium]